LMRVGFVLRVTHGFASQTKAIRTIWRPGRDRGADRQEVILEWGACYPWRYPGKQKGLATIG
jgi:hypothetical protein